jgi:hypothetical protein
MFDPHPGLSLSERRCRIVNNPASYSGGTGFKSRPRRTAILIEVFRGFPQSLQANAGIVGLPVFWLRPLPNKSVPIHHHSLVTPLSALYSLATEKAS